MRGGALVLFVPPQNESRNENKAETRLANHVGRSRTDALADESRSFAWKASTCAPLSERSNKWAID